MISQSEEASIQSAGSLSQQNLAETTPPTSDVPIWGRVRFPLSGLVSTKKWWGGAEASGIDILYHTAVGEGSGESLTIEPAVHKSSKEKTSDTPSRWDTWMEAVHLKTRDKDSLSSKDLHTHPVEASIAGWQGRRQESQFQKPLPIGETKPKNAASVAQRFQIVCANEEEAVAMSYGIGLVIQAYHEEV